MIVEKRCRPVETYTNSKSKLDLSLLRKKGNAKTYKGYLIQKMKEARKENNLDVCQLIQHFYQKYLEFETSETFKAIVWRGKSGVKFILTPNKVISIRYRKSDIGDTPKEVSTEMTREEINKVIDAINKLNEGDELIETRDIAEFVYKRNWKDIFATRPDHTLLVEILNYLEYRGDIHYYRSGKIKVLKKINWW